MRPDVAQTPRASSAPDRGQRLQRDPHAGVNSKSPPEPAFRVLRARSPWLGVVDDDDAGVAGRVASGLDWQGPANRAAAPVDVGLDDGLVPGGQNDLDAPDHRLVGCLMLPMRPRLTAPAAIILSTATL